MFKFPSVWVENSPDSLLDIALKFCLKNPNICCKYSEPEEDFTLKDDLFLPVGICERMLSICKTEMPAECFSKFVNYFKDTTRTHLRHLDLSDSLIEDRDLEILTKHSIVELNISHCERLTRKCLPFIADVGNSLVSLVIGPSSQIFAVNEENSSEQLPKARDTAWNLLEMQTEISLPTHDSETLEIISNLHFPLLRKLVINGLKTRQNSLFDRIFKSSNYLTYLDLSNCDLDCNDLECLTSQKQLASLILCNVMTVVQCVPAICQLKSLRFVIFLSF